jgi:hypothetical protein
MKELKWNGSTISVEPPKKPKKITGTHFPTIVGVNPFSTDFEVWCRCTRTYEIPFEGNKYTNAGQIIEPKVFDFLRNSVGFGDKVVTPEDVYGKDHFKKTWGDFYPDVPIFGGMWDALIKDENGNIEYVVEIKTVQVDGRSGSLEDRWKDGEAPHYQALQASLYAYLLGVDKVLMVAVALEEKKGDYEHPEQVVPSYANGNVYIDEFRVSERYPNFDMYIEKAKAWWNAPSNCTADNNPFFNVLPAHPYNVYHDMNHENALVKEQVKKSLEFLLTEYDIDGFRFDLTKGFTQKKTDPDVTAWGRYDQSRVDILKGYADHIWSVNDNAVVIFEHLADWDEEKVLADYGIQLWRNMNGSYRTSVNGGNGNFSGSYEASRYGGWVSYMESHDEERICYGATEDASSVTWGICGTLTSWGDKPDITMTSDGVFFVARNVTIAADDMFKIRGNSSWNDAFNYGASSKGYKLPLNSGYALTLGSGSQDMAAPAAGTYDIWFSPDASMVWLMTAGHARPANPSVTPGGNDGESALTVAMRRAGASAAFYLTVPGPKMIWQFGEIGYDYSINYNDRTGEKPVVTDQYMAVPARKALYDTYSKLLKFRRDNPRFFDSDAKFTWTPTGTVKKITCTVDGKTFHVVGNFNKGTTTVSLPAGQWKDYMNGNAAVSGSVSLKEGEFRLLTDF